MRCEYSQRTFPDELCKSDVDTQNGCLHLIPGSHKMTLQEMQQNSEVENVLGSGIDPNLVDESAAVDCVMQTGDVEVHHPNIIHDSNANISQRERVGLAIRYIAASTRITHPGWELFCCAAKRFPASTNTGRARNSLKESTRRFAAAKTGIKNRREYSRAENARSFLKSCGRFACAFASCEYSHCQTAPPFSQVTLPNLTELSTTRAAFARRT